MGRKTIILEGRLVKFQVIDIHCDLHVPIFCLVNKEGAAIPISALFLAEIYNIPLLEERIEFFRQTNYVVILNKEV